MVPNYKQIYLDIIEEKYPEKINDTQVKNKIENIRTAMDILLLNNLVFGKKVCKIENQKLHSYDETSIRTILEFQRNSNLNNTELAKHFKISRNTVAKWKKLFE